MQFRSWLESQGIRPLIQNMEERKIIIFVLHCLEKVANAHNNASYPLSVKAIEMLKDYLRNPYSVDPEENDELSEQVDILGDQFAKQNNIKKEKFRLAAEKAIYSVSNALTVLHYIQVGSMIEQARLSATTCYRYMLLANAYLSMARKKAKTKNVEVALKSQQKRSSAEEMAKGMIRYFDTEEIDWRPAEEIPEDYY